MYSKSSLNKTEAKKHINAVVYLCIVESSVADSVIARKIYIQNKIVHFRRFRSYHVYDLWSNFESYIAFHDTPQHREAPAESVGDCQFASIGTKTT